MPDPRYESPHTAPLLDTWTAIFQRQRAFGEHALKQLDNETFFRAPAPGMNSVGVIARHVAGNLLSRFTDFLTTDGEKPWRDREGEFTIPSLDDASSLDPGARAIELARLRSLVMDDWERGWAALAKTLGALRPEDLVRVVTIRGVPHAVHAALARQIDHYAFHVGQMSVIARMLVGSDRWQWFTIPPGQSPAFNERLSRPESSDDRSGEERSGGA